MRKSKKYLYKTSKQQLFIILPLERSGGRGRSRSLCLNSAWFVFLQKHPSSLFYHLKEVVGAAGV
ncbi:hypothetical protein, partial [Colwellia piezophila]|uniref:hypothetical protein n=1 Tax=Colwellia piezophila TaxID=211668 RepID=UPI001B7FAD08